MIAKQYIKDFEQLGFGMFIHFGLYSMMECGEWNKLSNNVPDAEYEAYAIASGYTIQGYYVLKYGFQVGISVPQKKFQNCSGSVDEKLPSCHFKKWEYEKLFAPLEYDVEFIYIFNDWFKDPKYRDALEYIERMGCYYFYNEIPLHILGL